MPGYIILGGGGGGGATCIVPPASSRSSLYAQRYFRESYPVGIYIWGHLRKNPHISFASLKVEEVPLSPKPRNRGTAAACFLWAGAYLRKQATRKVCFRVRTTVRISYVPIRTWGVSESISI